MNCVYNIEYIFRKSSIQQQIYPEKLLKYLQEQIYGLSGMIKFDTAGFRSEFQLDILNLQNQGLQKVGKWETNFGIQWKPTYKILGVNDEKSLRDKHFLVLISLVCFNNPLALRL